MGENCYFCSAYTSDNWFKGFWTFFIPACVRRKIYSSRLSKDRLLNWQLLFKIILYLQSFINWKKVNPKMIVEEFRTLLEKFIDQEINDEQLSKLEELASQNPEFKKVLDEDPQEHVFSRRNLNNLYWLFYAQWLLRQPILTSSNFILECMGDLLVKWSLRLVTLFYRKCRLTFKKRS